ncbi:phosphotransferase [Neiella marina]|uniref:Phosphotransferase n=1 Tax=Neiella holothuriorum TaxID=2870530 RepID=A0ABS7EKL4_9GAMM|nr:phosphotransferase [Neiella holothuriorum]MBW8192871.1 phosphotransferase [Neiella holothuriorum]
MSQPIQKRLQEVLSPYGIQPLSNIEICATSSVNEVFFVDTSRGRIALKHHIQNDSLERLKQEVALTEKLATFGVPTAQVLLNQGGQPVTEHQNTHLYIVSEFIDGTPLPNNHKLTESQIAQLAQLLAKFHLAGVDEELQLLPTHICSYDVQGLTNRLMTYRCELHTLEQQHSCAADLLTLIYNAMPKAMGLSRALPDELINTCMKSIIHADVQPSNFIFNSQDELVSCIDFDHARRDLRIYDIYQLAFLAVNSKFSLTADTAPSRESSWQDTLELILSNYEQIAPPLNPTERQCFVSMAEVHFLHQLADYQFDVTNDQCDITISKLRRDMVNLEQDMAAIEQVMAGAEQATC